MKTNRLRPLPPRIRLRPSAMAVSCALPSGSLHDNGRVATAQEARSYHGKDSCPRPPPLHQTEHKHTTNTQRISGETRLDESTALYALFFKGMFVCVCAYTNYSCGGGGTDTVCMLLSL